MKKALTFDIGGTKIYYTIVDEKGNIVGDIGKFSTPKTLDEIKQIVNDAVQKYEKEIDTIGISTAGAVNNENTRVISSTGNLVENYRDFDFQTISTKPVFVENDANAAAWAEFEIGASKNCETSVMITLGTGVGGGIIINNKLFKGKSGGAGEMHFKMYPDKRRKCNCGSWDCFEAYASGTGLRKTAQEVSKREDITTYDVIDGVKAKDEMMIKIFNMWINDITQGIIGLANLFDPECFVLSGSMAQFVDVKKMEQEVNSEIITMPTSIRLASTGNYAGMIGAGLLAIRALED